jgi:hypothetical protein
MRDVGRTARRLDKSNHAQSSQQGLALSGSLTSARPSARCGWAPRRLWPCLVGVTLSLSVLVSAATADAPSVQQASVSATGALADAGASVPAVSDTGSVVFASKATNLVSPAPGPGIFQVYLNQLNGAGAELVSKSPDGMPGDGHSNYPEINAAGTAVAFGSCAPSLGATPAAPCDSFLRQLGTGATSRIGYYPGAFYGFSPDGTALAVSYGFYGPYAIDILDTTTFAATRATTLGAPIGSPSLSAQGRYVAATPETDTNNTHQVFRWDVATGSTTLVSAQNGTDLASAGSAVATRPAISGDGSTVAFLSDAVDLTPDEWRHGRDVVGDAYVRDITRGVTRRISLSPTESPCFGAVRDVPGGIWLSQDGHYAAYHAAGTPGGAPAGTGCGLIVVDLLNSTWHNIPDPLPGWRSWRLSPNGDFMTFVGSVCLQGACNDQVFRVGPGVLAYALQHPLPVALAPTAPGGPSAPGPGAGTAPFVYRAIGDSIPAGFGLHGNLAATLACRSHLPNQDCDFPYEGYPAIVAGIQAPTGQEGAGLRPLPGPVDLKSLAVAGTNTDYWLDAKHLKPVFDANPNLVTITLGADDLLGDLTCVTQVPCVQKTAAKTQTRLHDLLSRLLAGTSARILITGYHEVPFDRVGAVAWLNKDIAAATAGLGPRVTFVAIESFVHHECQNAFTSWLVGPQIDGLCLHLNPEGHTVYARDVLAAWRGAITVPAPPTAVSRLDSVEALAERGGIVTFSTASLGYDKVKAIAVWLNVKVHPLIARASAARVAHRPSRARLVLVPPHYVEGVARVTVRLTKVERSAHGKVLVEVLRCRLVHRGCARASLTEAHTVGAF